MEDFIAAGINSLAILIAVTCFVICIIGILILKDTTDIKKTYSGPRSHCS